MGKSHFVRNASLAILALGVALVGINSLNKPIKIDKKVLPTKEKNITIQDKEEKIDIKQFSKKSFEENRTLEKKYKSVAQEIEAFIKKQKRKYGTTTVTEKENIRKEDIKKVVISKVEPVKKIKKVQKKVIVKKIHHKQNSKPKLAIIMDDVGFYSDIQKIHSIPFAITPSIFPSTKNNEETPKIAQEFEHYMVHLPMEAYKYKNMKEEPIKVTDSIDVLEEKISKINEDFPDAIAINNHTGSKYTCDFNALEDLFTVLDRYNINFIDSRTASGTQCNNVGKLLDKTILSRDIFLDNKADEEYIKHQLEKAVELAKKKGRAIAICHPRELTIKVLKNSKELLKDVKVVYVNELF